MTRDEATRYVVATLRTSVWLGGGGREATLDQPLGAEGLGLDSLGTVEFLTALEGSLEIRFPDEFWSRGPRTLGDIVDFVAAARARAPDVSRTPAAPSPRPPAAHGHGPDLVAEALREQGWWRGLRWTAERFVEHYGRFLYARQHQVILQRNFAGAPLPAVPAAVPLEFRTATPDDAAALSGFWPRHSDYWLRLLRERFANGSHCFVALHEGKIVGIDWVSGKRADTAMIGLRVEMLPGSCVGENLFEHQDHRRRGIGLALLAFSLQESRRLGYARQVTLVSAWNQRMLVTAVQLLGFQPIGEIVTTWRLAQPRTSWRVGDRTGVGGTLVL